MGISGQLVGKGSKDEKEKWCLDKLTLNGNLPLDVIEVVEVAKVFEKKNKDKSTRFTTRLVSKGGIYCCYTGKENDKLLEKAGFVEHDNCIPFLARSKGTKASGADAELKNIAVLEINIFNCK